MDTQYAEKFQCIRDATFIAVTWQVAVAEHISLLNQQAFYSNQKRPELYIRLQRTSSRTIKLQKHKITGIQPLSHIRSHILKQENILKNKAGLK